MTVKLTTLRPFRSDDVEGGANLPDRRLNRKDAANYLGFAAPTLANWALKGYGPPSFKVGGRRFYWLADLERFVAGEGA